LERIFINHPQSYDAPPPQGIPAASLSGHNRFSYSLTNPKRSTIRRDAPESFQTDDAGLSDGLPGVQLPATAEAVAGPVQVR